MTIALEELEEGVTESFNAAAELMRARNPAALELIKTLQYLKAKIGGKGDFKIHASMDGKTGDVVIETSLKTGSPDHPLSIEVHHSGLHILIPGYKGEEQRIFNADSPDENVLGAYKAIAYELMLQGQAPVPAQTQYQGRPDGRPAVLYGAPP